MKNTMDRDFTKDLDDAQNEYFGILHDVFTHDKDLLDKGIITQEEYDAKRKQILGL